MTTVRVIAECKPNEECLWHVVSRAKFEARDVPIVDAGLLQNGEQMERKLQGDETFHVANRPKQ